jgi:hypothetical protein
MSMGDRGRLLTSDRTEKRKPLQGPSPDRMQNMWMKVGQKVGGFFVANPTLLLTLLYALITGVGILSSWALYREFGINIFDYAEIGDFLLAAFKSPRALDNLIASLGSLSLIIVFLVLFAWGARLGERPWAARFRPGGSLFWLTVSFGTILYIIMFVLFLFARPSMLQAQDPPSWLRFVIIGLVTLMILLMILYSPRQVQSVLGWSILMMPILAVVVTVFLWVANTITASQAEALAIKRGEKPLVVVHYRAYSSSAGQVTKPGLVLIGATQRFVFSMM